MNVSDKRIKAAANARRAKSQQKTQQRSKASQPIDPAKAYTYEQCTTLLGIGRSKLLEYEDAGMPSFFGSREKWVRGAELIAAMERHPKKTR